MKAYRIEFKRAGRVLMSLEVMAADSISAAIAHLCLAQPGSYMSVKRVGQGAV